MGGLSLHRPRPVRVQRLVVRCHFTFLPSERQRQRKCRKELQPIVGWAKERAHQMARLLIKYDTIQNQILLTKINHIGGYPIYKDGYHIDGHASFAHPTTDCRLSGNHCNIEPFFILRKPTIFE